MQRFYNLDTFFNELFQELKCREETRAYITSLFTKFKKSDDDLSDESITIFYFDARQNQDFVKFQKLGDWILFSNTIADEHLKNASKEYYDNIARLSYYSCFKLINKKWALFEELADNYNHIEYQVKNILTKKDINL